jgi:hypothetical protein
LENQVVPSIRELAATRCSRPTRAGRCALAAIDVSRVQTLSATATAARWPNVRAASGSVVSSNACTASAAIIRDRRRTVDDGAERQGEQRRRAHRAGREHTRLECPDLQHEHATSGIATAPA